MIYLVVTEEAVYVLHAFKKKDQQTRQEDVDLAAKRFSDAVKSR